MSKTVKKKGKTKKSVKKRKSLIALSIIVLLIIGVIGGGAAYSISKINKMHRVKVDEADLGISKEIDEKLSKYHGIWNIALFGVDAPDGTAGRSDAILIATIDENHNQLKLTSIMRDSYVKVPGHGKTKINHAYAFGGHQLALKTINENYDLNIKDFATVNFSSLPKIIDAVGGLDLDIRKDEIDVVPGINDHIKDLNWLNHTNSPLITKPGHQHVNGTQALAYCRIRYTAGGDGERTERQRIVLQKLFDKFKQLSPAKYNSLLDEFMPMITTDLSSREILGLAAKIASMNDSKLIQDRFPKDDQSKGIMVDGVYYLSFNKEKTINEMHKFIFEN